MRQERIWTVEQVDREAAAWLTRLRSGGMGAAERAEMEARLSVDQELRSAFETLCSLWVRLDAVRADPAMLSMRRNARRSAARRRIRSVGGAVAAIGGVVLLGMTRAARRTKSNRTC